MPLPLDLRLLWYFKRTAEIGSLTKAAAQLRTSQPALTRQYPLCLELYRALKSLHRRHRTGLTGRPPDFLRFGITRDADVECDFVVIWSNVLIGYWPVMRAVMLALHLEIVR